MHESEFVVDDAELRAAHQAIRVLRPPIIVLDDGIKGEYGQCSRHHIDPQGDAAVLALQLHFSN